MKRMITRHLGKDQYSLSPLDNANGYYQITINGILAYYGTKSNMFKIYSELTGKKLSIKDVVQLHKDELPDPLDDIPQ